MGGIKTRGTRRQTGTVANGSPGRTANKVKRRGAVNGPKPEPVWTAGGYPHSNKQDGTVVCDGDGGLKVWLNPSISELDEAFLSCVTKHENNHIDRIKRDTPDVCKGQPNGVLVSLNHVPDQELRHLESELDGYQEEIRCLREEQTKSHPDWIQRDIKSRISDLENDCRGFETRIQKIKDKAELPATTNQNATPGQ